MRCSATVQKTWNRVETTEICLHYRGRGIADDSGLGGMPMIQAFGSLAKPDIRCRLTEAVFPTLGRRDQAFTTARNSAACVIGYTGIVA